MMAERKRKLMRPPAPPARRRGSLHDPSTAPGYGAFNRTTEEEARAKRVIQAMNNWFLKKDPSYLVAEGILSKRTGAEWKKLGAEIIPESVLIAEETNKLPKGKRGSLHHPSTAPGYGHFSRTPEQKARAKRVIRASNDWLKRRDPTGMVAEGIFRKRSRAEWKKAGARVIPNSVLIAEEKKAPAPRKRGSLHHPSTAPGFGHFTRTPAQKARAKRVIRASNAWLKRRDPTGMVEEGIFSKRTRAEWVKAGARVIPDSVLIRASDT